MKRKLLTTLLIAAAASSASFAQVSFGPKLGLGISNMKDAKVPSGTTANSYTSIVTPQIGAVLNVQFGDYIALRPELLYLQRGGKISSSGADVTTRVSYLELPINVAGGVDLGPGRLELFAGPSIGYAIGGKVKAKYNSPFFGSTTQSVSVKGGKVPSGGAGSTYYINPLNVSLNFGVDYKFDFGLLVSVGYNLGLSNMNPHYADSNAESNRKDYVTRASSVNISVAYLFGGKK